MPPEPHEPLYGEWIECWMCGGGGTLADTCTCGDDTCCCLVPQEETCDECQGKGGWFEEESDDVS